MNGQTDGQTLLQRCEDAFRNMLLLRFMISGPYGPFVPDFLLNVPDRRTYRLTDGLTDRQTDGRTDPLTEMRGRI